MASSSTYAFFHCHYAFQKFPFFWVTLCVLHALQNATLSHSVSLNAHRLIASEMGLGSKVKLKKSLFRTVHFQRVAGERRSQNSRQSAHQSFKVVGQIQGKHLLPRKYSLYPFLSETKSTPGP